MPKTNPNYSEPMHCLVGSLLWQEILGDHFFVQNMFVSKNLNALSGKNCLSPCPKGIRPLIKPLIKEQFFHKFPRHWAMRGSNSL